MLCLTLSTTISWKWGMELSHALPSFQPMESTRCRSSFALKMLLIFHLIIFSDVTNIAWPTHSNRASDQQDFLTSTWTINYIVRSSPVSCWKVDEHINISAFSSSKKIWLSPCFCLVEHKCWRVACFKLKLIARESMMEIKMLIFLGGMSNIYKMS